MKYIKRFESLDQNDAEFYLEVTPEIALSFCNGKPLPSDDPIPLNHQILEYAFGMADDVTDNDYISAAIDVCDWFDGTPKSIKDGVNAINQYEFDYVSEGPDFVLGVNYDGESAEFGDIHVFLKDYRKIEVVFVYDCKKEKFMTPKYFRNIYSIPGLYNNIDKFNL